MLNIRIRGLLLAAVIGALLAGCGGNGSTSMNSSPAAMTPVVASGIITRFGSIFVNGTEFHTTSATVRENGQTVDPSQLAVGEFARIKGEMDHGDAQGTAEEVDVDEAVVGSITAIDITNNTLTVLAQTVKINAGTFFSKDIQPADITGLSVNETVRVDGLRDSSGDIVATRIEINGSSSPLQVVGTVMNLDSTTHTFMINALNVDYSSANLAGFPSGSPSNGDVVEVQGMNFDTSTITLTAQRVALQMTDREEAAGDDIEREGLVTRFASATDFDVAGNPVTTTTSTKYRNGTAADLALNVKVEVEGTLNSSNVLVASVVTFEHNGAIELQADATAVDKSAGTVTLLGVQVTVNAMTRFEDEGSAQMQGFNLNNVNVDDTLRVRGYQSPAGSDMVVATQLERLPSTNTVVVLGPFAPATSPDFTILGITIDASSATISAGEGTSLPLAQFLTQAVGQGVKVVGTSSGGSVVTASTIRIDNESGDEN